MRSNKSLFGRLQTLSASVERDQTEDFFSEALLGLFEHHPSICRRWLNSLDVDLTIPEQAKLTLETQVRYPELESTSHPRRPDIRIISQHAGGSYSVVLIESKHAATEGDNQLRDYAHILSRRHGEAAHRLLLYVTTRYEDKELLSDREIETGVEFFHTRWHHFYRFLSSSSVDTHDYYTMNLLRFMEELGMATANRLHPEDLVTLQRLPDSVAVMKEVLRGVESEFRSILGHTGGRTPRTDQLGDKYRYSLRHYTTHLQVLLGFFLNRGQDYPTLGLILEVRDTSKPDIFKHLRSIRAREEWAGKDLSTESRWSGIVLETSLSSFLAQDDHVDAMTEYCSRLLSELDAIRDMYPVWFDASGGVLDEEDQSEEPT